MSSAARRPALLAVAALSVGAATVLIPGSHPVGAAPAAAPTNYVQTSPGAFVGTVPDGVCAVDAEIRGGGGGNAVGASGVYIAGANGSGADIKVRYPVVPGQGYGGTVGGGGKSATAAGAGGDAYGAGGSNGGGNGGIVHTQHAGGGGGGWSNLQIAGTELIVAGGGGAGSGGHNSVKGKGGDAGLPSAFGTAAPGVDGQDGQQASGTNGGGKGGGANAPGAGGVNSNPFDATYSLNGNPGNGRSGGNGAEDNSNDSGGGAGGGYYGGGGGASTNGNGGGAPTPTGIGGAGGGGGSSYVVDTSPAGTGAGTNLQSTLGPKTTATATLENGADGLVNLTWVPCNYDLAITKSASPTSAAIGTNVTWTLTVTNNGPGYMSRGDTVTIADPHAAAGNTKVTSVSFAGGSNNPSLSDPALSCDVAAGDAMKNPVTCSRAYAGDEATGAPSTGRRGLNSGESVTIVYTEKLAGPPGTQTNTATVTDRGSAGDNSASQDITAVAVSPSAEPDTSEGSQGAPQSVAPLANDMAGDPGVALDPASLTLIGTDGDPAASVTIPNQGTYTISRTDPDHPRIVFTPLPGFSDEATPVTYRVADANGTTDTSTYTPTVRPETRPDTTSGPQGVAQSAPVLTNDTQDPTVTLVPSTLQLVDADGNASTGPVTLDAAEGSYSIDKSDPAHPRVVFTPAKTFTGTAKPITYQVSDNDGNDLQARYTPTLTPVAPDAVADTTSGPQGIAQSKAVLANDKAGDPDVPLDKSSLRLLDADGNPTTGRVTLNPTQGEYSLDTSDAANPRIVFTPVKTFVGEADPIGYRIADQNGSTDDSTYTPTLTAVTPTANPDTSSGAQNIPQSKAVLANDTAGDPDVPLVKSSLRLLDADGNPTTQPVTLNAAQGTYSLDTSDAANPKIVFTPVASYSGTPTPIGYRVADVNGTMAQTTYSPTVTPIAPNPKPDTTSGPQGLPQSVDPLANDEAGAFTAPLDPSTLKLIDPATGNPTTDPVKIDGQGTYRLDTSDPTHPRIVFTPLAGFTGAATPVTYRISDQNGTSATSTYTPTLTAVKPTAKPDSSTGAAGKAQSVDPLANDKAGDSRVALDPRSLTLLDADGNPATKVTVKGEGSYTIDDSDPANPRIVFTPVDGFTGSARPVTYRIADANGTTTTSKYTPTVEKPDVVDVGTVRSTGVGTVGDPVTVDPIDQLPGLLPGSIRFVAPNGDLVRRLVVRGQGVWTVDPETGLVTFTPEKGFTGNPDPVAIRGVKADGTRIRGEVAVRYRQPAAGTTADTGINGLGTQLAVGGLLVLLGGGLVFGLRRRRDV